MESQRASCGLGDLETFPAAFGYYYRQHARTAMRGISFTHGASFFSFLPRKGDTLHR